MRNQQVADAVRAIRDSTGLSQWDFAHRFDIPIRALQNWEQGITLPDFTGIARLLKVAGAKAHVIFEVMGLGEMGQLIPYGMVREVLDRAPKDQVAKIVKLIHEAHRKYASTQGGGP